MIYMIYAPSERPRVEQLVATIQDQYDVDFGLAPVGLEAGSDRWISHVQSDLARAAAVVVAMSDQSVQDETVILRFKMASTLGLPVLPLVFDSSIRPDSFHPDLEPLNHYNWLYYKADDEQFLDYFVGFLSEFVPIHKKKKRLLCFISYSRDNTAFAAKLACDLHNAGTKTWRDSENIPAGANWDREIEKAILDCTHVIFVATPSSVASENVQDEIGLAINKGKVVIPAMVETCELPLRVHRAQWVDFREDYDTALNKLCVQLGLKDSSDEH